MLLLQLEPAFVHKLILGLMDRLAKLVNQAVIMEALDALLVQHQGLLELDQWSKPRKVQAAVLTANI
ncbi:unnamed protein product [Blepharisma stoltei]|uniref:Uncharacterized protein n=1 Tax=Blepharisma stoltei TaxID=1481888 RepID=A0AAU9JDC9_9CILI|nr:unnamed protein product [Blepharisma stoltei]